MEHSQLDSLVFPHWSWQDSFSSLENQITTLISIKLLTSNIFCWSEITRTFAYKTKFYWSCFLLMCFNFKIYFFNLGLDPFFIVWKYLLKIWNSGHHNSTYGWKFPKHMFSICVQFFSLFGNFVKIRWQLTTILLFFSQVYCDW